MKRFLAIICILMLLACPAYAHSGRTDSKGGHTDHSTGEYHYHHGYSAHQHPDGNCPFDYDNYYSNNETESKEISFEREAVPFFAKLLFSIKNQINY